MTAALPFTVDVIVPLHRGGEAVQRCIESVLSAEQPQTSFELIVVDDASSEPELARWLREQRDSGRLTLLQQPPRDGFAAAVDHALALHRKRDVVVLHGEVEVAGDWLDRLAAHACRGRDIGTVVPFTSCGGVAGYPWAAARNPLPEEHTLVSLDLVFKRANAGVSIPVPFTCGPCMYLRRECLTAAGGFAGGPVVGEASAQQDFSSRATDAGFRHLLAADVFVQYQSAAALSRDAADSPAKHGQELPRYAAQDAELLADDLSRPSRRRVDLLRLAESPRHLILFVAHVWGGGIRRHMIELAAMIGERCNVLLLEPAAEGTVKLSWFRAGEDFSAYFSLPAELDALTSLLRALGLARIHFHHIHGLPRSVLELPAAVGVPYDCTLHDYYAICPQYHLVTEDGRYCGEPDAAGCAACLSKRPGQWGVDILTWRNAFEQLLRGAQRVIVPSHDVARRMGRYFPGLSTMVVPHPEEPGQRVERMVRVVTLGALSPEKGLHVLVACAKDAQLRSLPLSFRVLGPTGEPLPQWPHATVSLHGQYHDAALPQLLAAESPDVIWFPAQIPETYSYTLSVAMTTGLPIVASDIGALPERLANYPRALIVPWHASAETWNEALRAAAAREHPSAARGAPATLVAS